VNRSDTYRPLERIVRFCLHLFQTLALYIVGRGMSHVHPPTRSPESWSVVEMQILYDILVKYVDPFDPSLRTCIVCLSVANPFERLLQMECCKTTEFHFSCWFDDPHVGLNRTIGEVNRDVEKSSERIPLKKRCPTCQKQNAHAVEVKDHLANASKLEVVCKVCEGRCTSLDWFSHWQKTCAGAYARLCQYDVEACVTEPSLSPCDSQFWQFSLKARQTIAIVFIFLICLALVTSIIYG